MEHIMISPGKLKLMLTRNDLIHYELEPSELDSDNSSTRRSFRELLADVKAMSGFDASDDKVFIQFYPSRDGGAEIYITRLTSKREIPNDELPSYVQVRTVYGFDNLQDMIDACAHIGNGHFPDESSAWSGEGGYFLMTEDRIPYHDYLNEGKHSRRRSFIGDYGKIFSDPATIFYVKEHCLCFCEKNAVKMLGSML